ncbi:unnamed protein product [Callosobruchus maculatus]|nr:unnamed protein product [Callosobruchus maculatus]
MANYIYYTTMGGRAKIKLDVVPHKFDCQPNRKRQGTTTIPRPAAQKTQRQIIQEISDESSENVEFGESEVQNNDTVSGNTEENIDDSAPSNITSEQKVSVETQTNIDNRTVAVQVNSHPKLHSVSVQCKIVSIGVDKSCSPIQIGSSSTATSSIKPFGQKSLLNLLEDAQKSLSSSSFTHSNSSQDIYDPSENSSSTKMDTSSFQSPVKKSRIAKNTNYLMKNNLEVYTGVPQDWSIMLERMSGQTKININDIKLSLMKIQHKDAFERFRQFGMSMSKASTIFKKTVPVLANLLKKQVYMPEADNIKEILPIAIMDAFEIQIEKPSNPKYQILTWSEYKKCNTFKYLISCTPDGFINFISKGFGGRISDEQLFQKSGLLEELPEACAVIADRGFKNTVSLLDNKNIVSLLDKKNIQLIRPPLVNSGVNLSESDVLQVKRIAALRIHIARVIVKMREFDFLKPHAVVNHNMLPLTDDIVVIAAALVNLQAPIFSI